MVRPFLYKYLLLLVLLAGSSYTAQDTVCHIVISGDVLKLDGLVQRVPLSAVGIAPEIGYTAPDITATNAQRAIPAIVLLIDDSGSMMQNDKEANRYVVTAEIIDEIYRKEPRTRVAVVTFRNWLAWDWRENSMFRKISSPFAWNDSYFPLTPLDTVFADGKRGIDKIKGLFELDQWNLLQAFHSDSTERTRPQQYDADGNPIPSTQSHQGTDITLAFMAAKDALRSASAPPERQFIVFLSDGYHGGVDVEMEDKKLDYIEGEGVPATYTIFLGDSVKVPPQQLLTMIDNIKKNGYSAANPRSELWSIASSHDTLLALMQREILSQVYAPLRLASHARVGLLEAQEITEHDIAFSRPLALEPDTTQMTLEFTFPLMDADDHTTLRDTVIESNITFIRDESATYTNMQAQLGSQCYLRDMLLTSGDTPIPTAIRNSQTVLSAHFTLEGIAVASSQSAMVYALPTDDSLLLGLDYGSQRFSGTFNREQTNSATDGDRIIQHKPDGTIGIIWRNPDLPLDTLYREYPVSPYDPVSITSVQYRDMNHDGRIDEIAVTTDRAINESEFEKLDAERLIVPSDRGLTFDSVSRVVDDHGFVINVTQSETTPVQTNCTDSDSLMITEYIIGPYNDYVEAGTYSITDGIAPVIVSTVYTSGKNGDTLVVAFSEAIQEILSDKPFKFLSSDGSSYTMTVDHIKTDSNGVMTFRVISVNSASGIPAIGDSVWLAASAKVTDSSGNVQIEPNHRSELGITVPVIDFIAGAVPNPVIRMPSRSFDIPGWGTKTCGTVIFIRPLFPATDIKRSIENIEVRIYDAVGNLLVYNPENRAIGKEWYIYWDGTNHNKRQVGSGVYCAVITITVIEDEKRTQLVKNVKIAFR